MFSYLDPSVRRKLIESGRLIRINAGGQPIDEHSAVDGDDLTLHLLGPIPLPVELAQGEIIFSWYPFVRYTELAKADEIAQRLVRRGDERLFSDLATYMSVNSALVFGDLATADSPLIRVHSCCMSGDVFGSRRCECGPQLVAAMERIRRDPSGGAIIYMAGHEGRGIGLWAKAVTYLLQDSGQNTYEANRSLGLPDDCRDFSDAAAVLLYLLGSDRPIRLLSNNPKKRDDLAARGLTQIEVLKHVVGINEWNRRYLRAKRDWGHLLEAEDIPEGGDSADGTAADEKT